ncbi:MAG: IS1595 family transposase [Vicinamibacterales bacterium]
MATMTWPKTLQQAVIYFSDADRCLEAAIELRWQGRPVTCPTCGSTDVHFIATRRIWRCKNVHERRQFSVKIGTIMEDSPISLDKWMVAIWLLSAAKNGISSYELGRAIGITQKSAWFMLHRIRLAMQDGEGGGKLGGEVEADETFIGGKARFMHKDRRKRMVKHGSKLAGKVAVMGLLERHSKNGRSRVRTAVIPNVRRHSVREQVSKHVEPGATLNTDAFKSYNGLDADYVHKVIDHAECYVEGTVHTNGLENFWSLLKRALKGTYVSVEPFHLFRYLDEQSFRFNERGLTDAERFRLVANAVAGKRLTYRALTGQDVPESRAC